MPRLGGNLADYFESQGCMLSRLSVLDLGLQLLYIFEKIHNSGYVFNDLKLDNIMVGYKQQIPSYQPAQNGKAPKSVFAECNLSIIDFGFVTSYFADN